MFEQDPESYLLDAALGIPEWFKYLRLLNLVNDISAIVGAVIVGIKQGLSVGISYAVTYLALRIVVVIIGILLSKAGLLRASIAGSTLALIICNALLGLHFLF